MPDPDEPPFSHSQLSGRPYRHIAGAESSSTGGPARSGKKGDGGSWHPLMRYGCAVVISVAVGLLVLWFVGTILPLDEMFNFIGPK